MNVIIVGYKTCCKYCRYLLYLYPHFKMFIFTNTYLELMYNINEFILDLISL